MGPNWYERAEDQLVDDLNNGLLSRSEFDAEMRELNAQYRQAAEDAAQDAYDNYMGAW